MEDEMNKYLSLDQQIVHLFVDKSVMFEREEIDFAKNILRDNNYRNFVSCSKVKFAEFIDEHLMMYKTAEFKEWRAYFELDCCVSEHLMKNLTLFERTLNSRVSYYISELMESNELSNFEKNEIVSKVKGIKTRNKIKFKNYTGDRSWFYISEMSFGEMKQLLLWIYYNRQTVYFELVKDYSFLYKHVRTRMDELNILRNNLFHNKPLTVYLTRGNIYNEKIINNRFNATKWISEIKIHHSMRELINEVCESSINYIEIKNSLRKVG